MRFFGFSYLIIKTDDGTSYFGKDSQIELYYSLLNTNDYMRNIDELKGNKYYNDKY